VSGPTQVPIQPTSLVAYGTVTLFGSPSQGIQLSSVGHHIGPTTPVGHARPVWALPLSLAATYGVDFSFFSTRYLDVSLPWVGHLYLWIQYKLIRASRDHHLFVDSPKLIADFHALHRLLMPRHPPCALSNLTIGISTSNPIFTLASSHQIRC